LSVTNLLRVGVAVSIFDSSRSCSKDNTAPEGTPFEVFLDLLPPKSHLTVTYTPLSS
jgi:hypothetical protein